MTPAQYVVDNYPDANADHIRFFLNGYNYAKNTMSFEDLWDNLSRIDKDYFIKDYINEKYEDKFDNIEDAWDALPRNKAMVFLKEKLNNLFAHELYQLISNRFDELAEEQKFNN